MVSKAELEKMRQMNIQSVDIESLVDIREIEIDAGLEKKEKLKFYLQQVKNPYCVRYKNIKIRMQFDDNGQLLDEKMEQFLSIRNREN